MTIETSNQTDICRVIRRSIIQATTAAGSGHLSSSLSAVELMSTLMFGAYLRYDKENPSYIGNDRLIFSKGHASPLLYALWHVAGMISDNELLAFRSIESPLEGHPSKRFPFTDAATGSLGQGLSIGMGMALYAKRYLTQPFHTYVLLGDSELSEGSNWEAIQSAAYYEVENLTAIVDVNRLGQRGETMLGNDLEGYAHRFSAFGWKTITLSDGHNIEDIAHAYDQVKKATQPTVVLAKTIKGKGISFVEDRDGWHGIVLKKDQAKRALNEIGAPKEVVADISPAPQNVRFTSRGRKSSFRVTVPTRETATRSVYGQTAIQLFRNNPAFVALDAEVSNSTYAYPIAHAYPDRFFEMFIAEQHMVSMAVGLALRGMHPIVSTFAAFLTRAHDQIRMARYNNVAITFIGIHAGVSIGQDGVSQMGLEDLAMMRSVPDAVIFYPSDAVAAQNLIKLASEYDGISYIRMTRAKTPILYDRFTDFYSGGSHTLKKSSRDKITIVAAGITLHEALKAYSQLHKIGISCRIVDAYSVAPLDLRTLLKAHREVGPLLVVEDHYDGGGLGDSVSSALSPYGARVHHLTVTDIPHSGKPEDTLKRAGIDSEGIVRKVKAILSNDA